MAGEWKTALLCDLGRVVTGKTPLTSVQGNFGGQIPFVTPSDMDGRRTISTTARNLTEIGAASVKGSRIPAGSVMVSCIGSDMGKAVIAGRDCVTNQQINSIIVDDRFSCEFVYYNLSTRKDEIRNHASGAAQPILNKGDFSRLEITLPPLPEQRAIASVLGTLDDLIELNRETNEILEEMARTLFKSWFVDFDPVRAKLEGRPPAGMDAATAALFPDHFQDSELGQIPKGWTVNTVGDFIDRLSVGQKYDQKTVLPAGAVPVLDQGKSGVIGYHNNTPGVTATMEEPVVVFANHTCYMRLMTHSFSAIQNVLPFTGSTVDTFWAYYATEGRLSLSEYKGHWPDFVIQETVVPPRDLTVAFRQAVLPIVALIRTAEAESRDLATLRDTLLPKLLSGELSLAHQESINL